MISLNPSNLETFDVEFRALNLLQHDDQISGLQLLKHDTPLNAPELDNFSIAPEVRIGRIQRKSNLATG